MVKWTVRIVGILVVILGGLFWWLMLSGSTATKSAPGVFDLADWQSKASAPADQLPTSIRILEVGRDTAPPFAAQAGRFGAPVAMSYNAVAIDYLDRQIIIGGAVDRPTAEGMALSKTEWRFSDAAYTELTTAMIDAEQVLMTHEHLDHVMAISRHPDAEALAPNLVLNASQIEALPLFADGELAPALTALQSGLSGRVETIAPGAVIVPAAGHTPGSQMVFITLQSGEEILLIGDIVWNMGAIEALKTRPVLTQYMVFRPNYEDRAAIKQQVRALHDMMADNPELIVLPAHDREWLMAAAETDGIEFQPVE
jgi:glyoxylase-like metal-dependent hydrolase (beta-lactamase superfamily II)